MIQCFTRAFELGDVLSFFSCAIYLITVEKKNEEGIKYLTQAVEHGYQGAYLILALHYYNVESDMEKAAEYAKLALNMHIYKNDYVLRIIIGLYHCTLQTENDDLISEKYFDEAFTICIGLNIVTEEEISKIKTNPDPNELVNLFDRIKNYYNTHNPY